MRKAVAFACWTLFVWGTRLRIAWTQSSTSVWSRLATTLLVATFMALAAAVLWTALRSRRGARPDRRATARLVGAFTGWTALVWVVRMPAVVGAHQGAGFVAVHAGLAVVSVALGLVAWRDLTRSQAVAVRG